VKVNGGEFTAVPNSSESAPFPIQPGSNQVLVETVSDDGAMTRQYTVEVIKPITGPERNP
jgi:hypothetical protein